MTRKTALRRMLAGKKVYHPYRPTILFKYDEEPCQFGSYPLRAFNANENEWFDGMKKFFFDLPPLGWKEYHPEEKCQKQEQSS
jgi:hypothetical protein